MPAKKKSYPDISVNGRKQKYEAFNMEELEEDEIPMLMEEIRQAGAYSRAHDDIDSIKLAVSDTCLSRIERLVKNQLNRALDGKHVFTSYLEIPGDFIHEQYFIRQTYCVKTNFLFNFLKDIVSIKACPESIDERELSKLEVSLRGLFFLVAPQTDGAKSQKYKDPAFKPFARIIWMKSKRKKLTEHDFWACALKELIKHPYQVKLGLHRQPAHPQNRNKKDIFIFTLDKNKQNSPVIKITCESSDNPHTTLITRSQVKRNWPKMQKEFIRNKNKNDG